MPCIVQALHGPWCLFIRWPQLLPACGWWTGAPQEVPPVLQPGPDLTFCNRQCVLWLCSVDTEGLCDSTHNSRHFSLEGTEGTEVLPEGGSPWTRGPVFHNTSQASFGSSVLWQQQPLEVRVKRPRKQPAKKDKAPKRNKSVWCLCAGPKKGQMVACDNQNCTLQVYPTHCFCCSWHSLVLPFLCWLVYDYCTSIHITLMHNALWFL